MTAPLFVWCVAMLVAGSAAWPAVPPIPEPHSSVLAASVAGGQPSASPVEDEQALRARVDRWWKAREERDHQTMYDLYDPGYKDTTPFSKFLQESAVRSRFDIASHRITKIEARPGDRVAVFIEIDTVLPQFGGRHSVTTEEPWLRHDGVWYKVHEPYKPPFPQSRERP